MIRLQIHVQPHPLVSLDGAAARLSSVGLSESEFEALGDAWGRGEDVRLREDPRFRPTPWGRWVAAGRELVNDRVHTRLLSGDAGASIPLAEALGETPLGVFCSGDPRFRFTAGAIRIRGEGDEPEYRDLASTEGQESIRGRLRAALDRALEAPVLAGDAKTPGPVTRAAARLVCLAADEGGLHVETDALPDLPTFVKRLQLVGSAGGTLVLAANLRTRTWLTRVAPAAGRYRWTAPGFEEELGARLAGLTTDGLPADSVTVFRVDAAGIGRTMTGRVLTPGRQYRVVFPPGSSPLPDGTAGVTASADGWRMWEFTAPDPNGTDSSSLAACGLELGVAPPRLSWVAVGPSGYHSSSTGESVPGFAPGETPTLLITAPQPVGAGELAVFVLSGEQFRVLQLPPGREWLVGLDGLPVGRHAVQVLHRSTEVPPEWEPFVVGPTPTLLPAAHLAVALRGERLVADPDGTFLADGDFSELLCGPEGLELTAPRYTNVRPIWDDGRRLRLRTACGQSDGSVDLTQVVARTGDARRLALEGNLVLECAELGRVVLRHSRTRDPAETGSRLRELLQSWGDTLAGLGDQFPLIRSAWLTPVFEVLGYEMRDLGPEELAGMPAGTTAVQLFQQLRREKRVVRTPAGVLLLAAAGSDFTLDAVARLRGEADKLCHRCDCEFALVTQGTRWLRHRRGYWAPARVWDLYEITRAGAESQFAEFYETVGG